MNWSAALVLLVPSAVVTVTSTVPRAPEGTTAVIVVGLLTVKVCDVFPGPKSTLVAPDSPVPVIVTVVPPVIGPEAGLTPVTVGTGGDV